MNVGEYIDTEAQVVNTFPKYSFVISTAPHPNGKELAIVLGMYYTPSELLDSKLQMTNEEVIDLVSRQNIIGQIVIPKGVLFSNMWHDALDNVRRS